MKSITLAAVAIFLLSKIGAGMQIIHQSLESVVQQSDLCVIGEVKSVSQRKEIYWKILELRFVKITRVFGQMKREGEWLCTYKEAMPHSRQGIEVSPRVSGS